MQKCVCVWGGRGVNIHVHAHACTHFHLFETKGGDIISKVRLDVFTFTGSLSFQHYPQLMSQAVYASFAHCFSDSYRQFGEEFKNELVYLVYGWMAGTWEDGSV